MPMQMLARLDSGDLAPILALCVLGLTGVLIAVPAILSTQWRLHRKSQGHIQLKREMVARGMSAGEIERVMLATGLPELVKHGFSTEAIERLTRGADSSEEGLGSRDGAQITDGRRAAAPAKGAPLDPEI
jgi:hypothetical protein